MPSPYCGCGILHRHGEVSKYVSDGSVSIQVVQAKTPRICSSASKLWTVHAVPIRAPVRISRLDRSNSDVARYFDSTPVRRCVNPFRNALTRQSSAFRLPSRQRHCPTCILPRPFHVIRPKQRLCLRKPHLAYIALVLAQQVKLTQLMRSSPVIRHVYRVLYCYIAVADDVPRR